MIAYPKLLLSLLMHRLLSPVLAFFAFLNFVVASELPDAAARYHDALLRHPESESLFERFVDAWLEESDLASLEYFLSDTSDAPSSDFLLAKFHSRQGNDLEAANSAERIVKDENAPPELRARASMLTAKVEEQSRDYDSALGRIRSAQEILEGSENDDLDLTAALAKEEGELLFRLNRRDEGLDVWRRLISDNPEDAFLREDFIEMLSRNNIHDEAIREQRELIESMGDDVYGQTLATLELGKLQSRARREDEAVETWLAALAQTGRDTWIERESIGLIDSMFRRRDDLVGLKELWNGQAAEPTPRLAVLVARAEVLTDLRESTEAVAAWSEILEATPGNRDLRERYISALSILRKPEEAVEQMKRLVAQYPEDQHLTEKLAHLEQEAGQTGNAVETLLEFLEQSDSSEGVLLRVARTLNRWDRTTEADEVFEVLVATFPDSESAMEAFAAHLFDTDRKTRAVALVKELGREGDASRLLRSSRFLSGRFESEAAFDLLHSRLGEFESNPTYLGELAETAMVVDRDVEALEWSLAQLSIVSKGSRISPIRDSISLAVRSARAVDPNMTEALSRLENRASESVAFACLQAELLDTSGQTEEAVALLESVDGNVGLLPAFTLASILRRHQRWKEAAEVLAGNLEMSDGATRADMLREIVSLFGRAKDPTAALPWLQEWKKAVPNSPDPWLREADFLEQRGETSDALRILRQAAGHFEEETNIRARLAKLYAESGYPAEAERTYWELYDAKEDFWLRRRWIADLAEIARQRNGEKALIEKLEQRAAGNRQSIQPLLALAEAHRLFNNRDEQRDALGAARRIEPDNIAIVHEIASLHEADGDYEAAMRELEGALDADRTDRTAVRISSLLVLKGDLAGAVEWTTNLPSGVRPTSERILGLANTLMMAGEWTEAAAFLEKMAVDHSDDLAIHYLLAVALREAGESGKAVSLFTSMLDTEEMPDKMLTPHWHGWHAMGSPNSSLSFWASHFANATLYRGVAPGERVFFPRNLGYDRFGNRSQSPEIALPGNPGEARAMAAKHLVELHGMEDPSFARDILLKNGLPAKLADLGLATVSSTDPLPTYLEKIVAFSDKYPDDPDVAGYLLGHALQTIGEAESTLEAIDRSIRILNEVGESNEALQFAIRYRRAAIALELVKGMDRVPASWIPSVAKELTGKDDDIDPELIPAMKMLFENWTSVSDPEADKNGLLRAISSQLSYFHSTGDTSRWIERITEEWKAWSEASGGKPVPGPFHHGGDIIVGRGVAKQAPSFLGEKMLLAHTIWNSIPPEDLGGHRDEFNTTPLLGAILAFRSNDETWQGDAVKILEKIPADSPDYLDAQILLAHRAEQGGDATAAAEIASSLRRHELSEKSDHLLDTYLVRLAVDSEPDTPLRRIAVEAAERLRLSRRLDLHVQWYLISQIVQGWGEEKLARRPPAVEAANRLASQKAHQQPTGVIITSPSRHPGSFPSSFASASAIRLPSLQSLQTIIRANAKQDDKDAVARILSQQLPLAATSLLSTTNGQNVKSQAGSFVGELQNLSIIEKVIESADPGSEARPLEKFRYAVILEMFAKDEAAVAEYRQLLADHPGHPMLRSRLLVGLSQYDSDSAVDEIVSMAGDGEVANAVGTVLGEVCENLPREMEKVVAFAQALVPHLPELLGAHDSHLRSVANPDPFASRSRGNWLQQLGSQLERNLQFRDKGIPGILDFRGEIELEQFSGADQARLMELIPQRLQAYQRILETMIEEGEQNHSHAFGRLSQLVAMEKYPAEKLSAIAVDAAKGERSSQFFSAVLQAGRNLQERSRDADGNWVWKEEDAIRFGSVHSPLLWKIEHATDNDDRKFVDQRIRELSEEAEESQRLPVREIAQLYRSSPGDFQKNAEAFLNFYEDQTIRHSDLLSVIRRVIFVRPELEEPFDPDPLIFASLSHNPEHTATLWARERVAEIASTAGREAMAEYLGKVEEAFFGETGDPDEILAQALAGPPRAGAPDPFGGGRSIPVYTGRNSSASSQRLQRFAQFLNSMLRDPACAFGTYRYARLRGYSETGLLHGSSAFGARYDNEESIGNLVTLLETGWLLGSVDEFDPLPKADFRIEVGNNCASLVGDFLTRLKNVLTQDRKPELNAKLLEELDLGSRDTFGADLVAAVLSSEPDNAIVAAFDKHIVPIQNLTEEESGPIARLAMDLVDFGNLSDSLTNDQRRSLRSLYLLGGTADQEDLERFARARTFEEIGIEDPAQLEREALTAIERVIQWDWPAAFDAYRNVARIGDELVAEGRLERRHAAFSELLLSQIANFAPAGEMAAFFLASMRIEDHPVIISPIYGFFDEFPDRVNRSGAPEDDGFARFKNSMRNIEEALTDEMNEEMLFPLLFYYFQKNKDVAQQVADWAGTNAARIEFPKLAEPPGRAARIELGGSDEIPAEEVEFLRNMISSEDYSLSERILVSWFLAHRYSNIPNSGFEACFNTLAEAYENGKAPVWSVPSRLLERFEQYRKFPLTDLSPEIEGSVLRFGRAFHDWEKKTNSPDSLEPPYRIPIDKAGTLLSIFNILTRLPDPAAANIFFEKYADKFEDDMGEIFAITVAQKKFAFAEKLIRTRRHAVVEDLVSSSYHFDAAVEKCTEGFLATFSDAASEPAIAAEFAMIRLHDPYKSGRRSRTPEWDPTRDIRERLIEFGKRIPPEKIEEKTLRLAILDRMSEYREVREAMSESFEAAARSMSLADIVALEPKSRTLFLSVLRGAVLVDLENGNTGAFEKTLEQSAEISESEDRQSIEEWIQETLAQGYQNRKEGVDYSQLWVRVASRETTELHLSFLDMLGSILISKYERFEMSKFFELLPPEVAALALREWRRKERNLEEFVVSRSFARRSTSTYKVRIDFEIVSAEIKAHLFLQTDSALAVDPKGSGFQRDVARIISGRDLDPALVRKVYHHACGLVDNEQAKPEGYDRYFWNGWSFSSDLFRDIHSGDWGRYWSRQIAAAQIWWNDPPADLTLDFSSNYKHSSRFELYWQNEAGILGEARAIKAILAGLADELSQSGSIGNTAVFFPAFYEACHAIGEPVRVVTAANAALDLAEEIPDHPVVREFAMASRLWLQKHEDEYCGHEPVRDPDAWKAHALAAVSNETLPLSLRTGLARHFLVRGRGRCPEELIRASVEVAAETMNSKHPVNNYTVAAILHEFDDLPRDNWWKNIAPTLVAGWNHQTRHRGENHRKSLDYNPSIIALAPVLELHLAVGDEAALSNFYEMYRKALADHPDTLALLVRAGDFARASDWLKHLDPGTCQTGFAYNSNAWIAPYDGVLHERASKFIETLTDGPQRWIGEAILRTVPDPDEMGHAHPAREVPDRTGRLSTLGKQWAASEVQLDENEAGMFYPLLLRDYGVESTVRAKLETIVESFTNDSPLAEISDHTAIYRRTVPLAAHAILGLDAGKTDAFATLVSSISEGADNGRLSSNRAVAAEHLAWRILCAMPDLVFSKDERKLDAYRTGIEFLLASWWSASNENTRRDDLIVSHAILSQLLGKDPSGWDNEIFTQRHEDISRIMNHQKMEAPHLVARFLGTESSAVTLAPESLRWQIARTIMNLTYTKENFAMREGKPLLRHFLQHRILTPEEVAAHADELAELGPATGLVAVEAAEICLLIDDEETAVELIGRVPLETEARNSDESENMDRCRLRVANVLRLVGDEEGAMEIFNSLKQKSPRHSSRTEWLESFEKLINDTEPNVTE